MLNCKNLTHLVSQSMDENLPWRTRMAVRFHVAMCRRCRIFERQLNALRDLVRRLDEDIKDESQSPGPDSPCLSEAARQRIRERLEKSSAE